MSKFTKAKNRTKAIYPRKQDADRFDCGKLRPPGPNPRVIEIRRELLGAGPKDKVDLSKAENALDVALERGWLSMARHIAARRYAVLCRRVLVVMPGMKTSKTMTDLAPFSSEDGVVSRSGVVTVLDQGLKDLALLVDRGVMTPAEYTREEKKHRAADIDWSRLPDEDVAAIWNAAFDVDGLPGLPSADDENSKQLRDIWARLTPEEAGELRGTCVQESWPWWVIYRAQGKAVPARWDASRIRLERALDVVRHVLRTDEPRPPPPVRAALAAAGSAAPLGPVREDHTTYVDPTGALLFEAVRRTRAPR